MNSEELEQSLRTEFEDYLKNVFTEMREDISGFQAKIESAIDDHKSQMEQTFKQFAGRFEDASEMDEGFRSSIIEHLRLAKDEGARITAQAVADAEQFDEDNRTEPEADFSELRDAISEISKQDSQAEILKSLVNNAANFTPRGAFFIIKNDHFVGWRVFGKEDHDDDQAIRDVFFPLSSSTVLSDAAKSLETAESSFGSYTDDSLYLNKLNFGQPDRMYAIPLIARGRSVAVLYADYGQGGTNVNLEALETLVQVAGLTVELLAASRNIPKPQKEEAVEAVQAQHQPEAAYETPAYDQQTETTDSPAAETGFSYQAPAASPAEETAEQDYSYSESSPGDFQPVAEQSDWEQAAEAAPVTEETYGQGDNLPEYSDNYGAATESYQPTAPEKDFQDTAANDYKFDNSQFESNQYEAPAETPEFPVETANFDNSQFETFATPHTEPVSSEAYTPAVTDDYSGVSNDYKSYDAPTSYSGEAQAPQAEPASEPVATEPVRTRFSDRNVDLPIEVNEDERRLHNDARRFARLLVSEIKLYNEQKVKEGRETRDVYERLREAIDRSREMYDKRVQSPVSAKFDYFHYELVNSLADGDETVLGDSYPGASM